MEIALKLPIPLFGTLDIVSDPLEATITIDGCACFLETIDTEDVLGYGNIVGNLTGNVTGNLTGDVTGSASRIKSLGNVNYDTLYSDTNFNYGSGLSLVGINASNEGWPFTYGSVITAATNGGAT